MYLGAGHGIYSVRASKLFTIVADTMGGGHDTIGGCCSAASNMFRFKVPDTPSCYANFLRALARHGMGEKDIVANITVHDPQHLPRRQDRRPVLVGREHHVLHDLVRHDSLLVCGRGRRRGWPAAAP